MLIITNRLESLIQKVIDYVQSLGKSKMDLDPKDAQEIRYQMKDDNFKQHLTQSIEFGEVFEPISIDVESVYKFYNRLRETSLPTQKQTISTKQIESICNNLNIAIPDIAIKNCSEFSDYIIEQILKLDHSELVSSWLVKNQSSSLILAEVLDILNLLELLAREKYEEIDRLLTGWEINIVDVKKEFSSDISSLKMELS